MHRTVLEEELQYLHFRHAFCRSGFNFRLFGTFCPDNLPSSPGLSEY